MYDYLFGSASFIWDYAQEMADKKMLDSLTVPDDSFPGADLPLPPRNPQELQELQHLVGRAWEAVEKSEPKDRIIIF